jgi:hypothetical protein
LDKAFSLLVSVLLTTESIDPFIPNGITLRLDNLNSSLNDELLDLCNQQTIDINQINKISKLLSKGANINIKDNMRKTPLRYSIESKIKFIFIHFIKSFFK